MRHDWDYSENSTDARRSGKLRVTLDLDAPTELGLLKAFYNLQRFGEVELRESSGGHGGYHMICRGLPISYEDSLRIRETLGDDSMRLRFDEEKNHKPKSILWRAKVINGKRHEARTITERDLLSLPFLSKIHGGWYKWKRG